MDNQHRSPAMSQKIFSLQLSTETISVYLMCCGLTDAETTLSSANMLDIWNGSEADLYNGLAELTRMNIIRKIISDQANRDIYTLTNTADWEQG